MQASSPSSNDPILRFDRVNVKFYNVPALVDVSFEVHPGETRVIFGAAGSGKTVLLKTALGLVRPDSGRVYLFGQDITRMKEDLLFDVRSRVGILFQESALFDSQTIQENVAYPLVNRRLVAPPPPEQVDSRVREALRFVELEHTLEKFPSELSGGMRRRVGIARAAVTAPPLILYDSPTGGLDPVTANTIIALVVKERDSRNTCSLIVTHRYQDGDILANFRYNPQSGTLQRVTHGNAGDETRTKFMVFQQGKLVFHGTQNELETSSDPYVKKFKRQYPSTYANGQ